jgi:NAD(P)-dependent dehydrogenase (short-subunit alcohol dehydrogenase family)
MVIEMQIKDTVVIVTGGGSGLGAATAQHLSQLGAKVAIFDANKDAALSVAKQINGLGLHCDVTDEASVTAAIASTKEKYGAARICLNFAGILGGGRVVGRDGPMPLDDFRTVVDIDLIGTFNVMRLALADMVKLDPLGEAEERGVVINIASIAATDGQIGQAAYSASKGGVAGMTLPVAREMADWNIRVVSVCPGVFETPMMQHASDKVRNGLLATTVFPKRFGLPKELAMFIEQIIINPMLNGSSLRIDGAMRMPPK